MGLAPSKQKISKILENSITNLNIFKQKEIKIEYKVNYLELIEEKKEENLANKHSNYDEKDSFMFSGQETSQAINNPKYDVKKTNIFPYSAIGTISVQFPVNEEKFINTCFLINTNVVVTLASNLENKNKGGKAELITTSFSKERVKWTNIFIQGEEKSKGKSSKKEDKNKAESLDNFSSKLAVILYDNNISSEWLGVESGKKDDFELKDIYTVFSFKEEKNNINIPNINIEGEKKESQIKFREIQLNNMNPFLDIYKNGEEKDKELIKQSPGSPLFYKDFNNGAYIIAFVNEGFEFQYFDKKTMIFLANMVNKGKLQLKKVNKGIDEENIVQLDLGCKGFEALDIKYLTEFNLQNLRILDLSNNILKPQGALYLSEGTFSSLECLNLNLCEIGDEGLKHLSNGTFNKLNHLYLFHNNISSEGIKHLCTATFISNLILLSLTDNPNIRDNGIKYMKENKDWEKLNTLNLNNTGLTDLALEYLVQSCMPKLQKLNIQDNKFTDNGKASMKALKVNGIKISFRTDEERKRLKEKKEKEKEKERNKK